MSLKIALIEPMPLLNKGITLYLQRQKKVSRVRAYNKFEEFSWYYSDLDKCFFDLFIINISRMNIEDTNRMIRLVTTFFTEKDRIVLIVDKQSEIDTSSIESIVTLLNLEDDLKLLGSYIRTIGKKCE